MSQELKRYHEKADGGMFEAVDGYWVRYADVATRPQPAEAKDAPQADSALREAMERLVKAVSKMQGELATPVPSIYFKTAEEVQEVEEAMDALAALQSTPPAGGEG